MGVGRACSEFFSFKFCTSYSGLYFLEGKKNLIRGSVWLKFWADDQLIFLIWETNFFIGVLGMGGTMATGGKARKRGR